MTTLQNPSSRPLSIHNVVLGVAIGLAILCAAITLVVVLERQRSEPELGSAIARLDEARDELHTSAANLREAAEALQTATRSLERAPTTINIMDMPPATPATPVMPDMPVIDAPDEPAMYCPEPGRCVLPRAYLEEMLANPSTLAKQARVIPSIRDGVTRGFKMYGVRPDSLPKRLGFKNGDLVIGVNGLPLTSMEHAMGAYTKLRNATVLTVEIERKGEFLQKEITIK